MAPLVALCARNLPAASALVVECLLVASRAVSRVKESSSVSMLRRAWQSWRARLPVPSAIPLRAVLIVPLALELAVTSGIIIVLNARNAEQNARATAEQLMLQASGEVKVYLDGYMRAPQQVIRTMAEAVESGLVDPRNEQAVALYFSRLKRIFPSASYLNYSLTDSTLIGVGQATLNDPDTIFLELSKPALDPVIRRYRLFSDGRRGPLVRAAPFSDFRDEDWFATPLKLGRPTWTAIYNWPDQPDVMVVSAGMPLTSNGQLIGLSGVDVLLSNVSRYLQNLRISRHAVIFVAEADGLLVATSTHRLPFDIRGDQAIRRAASLDSDPTLRLAAREIQHHAGGFKGVTGEMRLHVERGDDDLLIRASEWKDPDGLRWIVVLAAPESDFTAVIRRQTRSNLLLTIVIIAIAIGLGWVLVRLISRPIERVSDASESLASSGVVQAIDQSWILETNRLVRSFTSMANQLLSSMHQLADRNASMEREIAERTEELRQANLVLRQEVTIAAGIQRDLLIGEREINRITPGLDVGVVLVPSKEVAGDLYDCIAIGDQRWCVCVGDVSGKGVPAALLMSTCLSLLRSYSEVLDSPAAIMRRINNRLVHNNESCAFTTLVIASINGKTGELRWCNAGHNPPLLLQGGRAVESLSVVHGPALGVVADVDYLEDRLQLHADDLLILYSDGVSEMFNADGNRFGIRNMKAFLASPPTTTAPRLVRAFLRHLRDYAAGEPQRDVVTLMAIRRLRHSGRATPLASVAKSPPRPADG
jgi:sigma-B regulation protein RsbU (phosphoserine phosphatase)